MGAMPQSIVADVRQTVDGRLHKLGEALNRPTLVESLRPGKMLRTRLAEYLAHAVRECSHGDVIVGCAATELVHTASLCHDDIIDGARLRRHRPTFWKENGVTEALLVGDMLLCVAFGLVAEMKAAGATQRFSSSVGEVCAAECDQELLNLNRPLDSTQYLVNARRLTGPLFAFPAWCCGGDDTRLREALSDAGSDLGTAYQVADDLLDVVGTEKIAGKTLGTDSQRSKATIANSKPRGVGASRRLIDRLLRSATGRLDAWPEPQRAMEQYLHHVMRPTLDRHLSPSPVDRGVTERTG